jgi:diguanylate cyclase (GGDEF)-like protein
MAPTPALPVLLVVDDEKEITASLADQFRRVYQVVTADSADEALAVLKRMNISVIVADQRMPGKSGSEMLAEACLVDPDAVRILLTGYADIEAVIQAVNQGQIFFYLTKPWRSNEMAAVIAKAMEHNFLRRDNRHLIEELRQINAELEERVKERTLQLEQRALELEEASRKISELVYLDPLTNVANRRRFEETLTKEVERGTRLVLPLTVILLDVDHFKVVNDTFGHAMGDKVLQSIAQTVSGMVRPYDLLARFGGEEFLIMMPSATLSEGGVAAERFRAAISAMTIEGFSRNVTASFGVATLLPGHPTRTLFERVDRALYRAKQSGRDRVEMDRNNAMEDSGD